MYNTVMTNNGFELEKILQFETDKAAFNSLSPQRQWWANKMASGGYLSRWAIVGVTRAVVTALEIVLNLGLRLPYVLLGRGLRTASNAVVGGVKLGIRGSARLAQAALGISIATANKMGKDAKKIRSWKECLPAWEQRTVEKVDRAWKLCKRDLKELSRKAGEFAEYHGAISLYRGTKWLLNPRTSSGNPLFGNEVVNKTIGLALASAAFIGLSIGLSKFAVAAKIWHYKFAKSFATDASPVFIKMLKQAAFHPMLTVAVTAVKFVTLPAIAAARQTLKSTPFNQGVAYQYNLRLAAKDARRQQQILAREKNTPGPKFIRVVRRYMHKKSLSFVGNFFSHIIERAAPEHYAARIKYYAEKKIPTPSAAPVPDIRQADSCDKTAITPDFDRASSPGIAKPPPSQQGLPLETTIKPRPEAPPLP